MEYIKERIMLVVEMNKHKKKDFFEAIGMTRSNFVGKNKTTPINSNALAKILELYPDISPDWLLSGKGDVYQQGQLPQGKQELNIRDYPRGVYLLVLESDAERWVYKFIR